MTSAEVRRRSREHIIKANQKYHISLRMGKMMSLLLLWDSMTIIFTGTEGFVDNAPNCFKSCSNQVSCSISMSNSYCGAEPVREFAEGPDIAAEPVDLRVDTLHDADYQYVHLSWRPPQDGSYNYLRGFLVQVSVILMDHDHTVVRGPLCYKILPDSTWFQTHRKLNNKDGVTFFMNCLRTSSSATLDVIITIHSLPLKHDAPKLAYTTVFIRPEVPSLSWEPRIKKWADTSDVMHLVIENPLKEARFYDVQIQSVERDDLVFSHVFPAMPDNSSTEQLSSLDHTGKLHFLVHGLNKDDSYILLMDVLDENETHFPHILSMVSSPFSLNFSTSTTPISATPPIYQGLGNNLIICVFLITAVATSVFVCLVYKRALRPCTLRTLVRNSTYRSPRMKSFARPSFTPIFCHENDNFVGAVESHISLLNRYIDAVTSPQRPHALTSVCVHDLPGHSSINMESNHREVIVYLSPKLKEILTLDQETPPQFSNVDIQCHKTLLALNINCLPGRTTVFHLVTFDCFQKAELALLDTETFLKFRHQLNAGGDTAKPLSLASFSSDGMRLENLEVLLLRLFRLEECPKDVAYCLQGWRTCKDARDVERYLSLLHDSSILEHLDTRLYYSHESPSVLRGFDNARYSNITSCSRDRLQSSRQEPANKVQQNYKSRKSDLDYKSTASHRESHQQSLRDRIATKSNPDMDICDDYKYINSHDSLKVLPEELLVPTSNGCDSRSDPQILDSCMHRTNVLVSLFDTPELLYHKVQHSSSCTGDTFSGSQQSLQMMSGNTSELPFGKKAAHTHQINTVYYRPDTSSRKRSKIYSCPGNLGETLSMFNVQDLTENGKTTKIIFGELTGSDDDDDCDRSVRKRRLGVLIPPSMAESNRSLAGSVSELINKINDCSCWSESSLSK